MGGRGAASGLSEYRNRHGKMVTYGSEYRTVLEAGRIKFVKQNSSVDSITAPKETQTSRRIYVTVGKKDKLKAITLFSKDGRRRIQLDLDHEHNKEKPHKHGGYDHNIDLKMTRFDKWLIAYVERLWKERKND